MYMRRLSVTTATVAAVLVAGGNADGGALIIVPVDAADIQAAIDVATDGDIVEVIDGTWSGAGNRNLDFGGRLITVRSMSGDPELCTIDCENAGRGFIFQGGEDETAVVSGFTILNGISPPNTGGGGMIIVPGAVPTRPTITNCIFRSNFGQTTGGAISMFACSSLVTNCQFLQNTANLGAGVFVFELGEAQHVGVA